MKSKVVGSRRRKRCRDEKQFKSAGVILTFSNNKAGTKNSLGRIFEEKGYFVRKTFIKAVEDSFVSSSGNVTNIKIVITKIFLKYSEFRNLAFI